MFIKLEQDITSDYHWFLHDDDFVEPIYFHRFDKRLSIHVIADFYREKHLNVGLNIIRYAEYAIAGHNAVQYFKYLEDSGRVEEYKRFRDRYWKDYGKWLALG